MIGFDTTGIHPFYVAEMGNPDMLTKALRYLRPTTKQYGQVKSRMNFTPIIQIGRAHV